MYLTGLPIWLTTNFLVTLGCQILTHRVYPLSIIILERSSQMLVHPFCLVVVYLTTTSYDACTGDICKLAKQFDLNRFGSTYYDNRAIVPLVTDEYTSLTGDEDMCCFGGK